MNVDIERTIEVSIAALGTIFSATLLSDLEGAVALAEAERRGASGRVFGWDQIARASSSNASASRCFGGAWVPSS
jgi:hypothetical protein